MSVITIAFGSIVIGLGIGWLFFGRRRTDSEELRSREATENELPQRREDRDWSWLKNNVGKLAIGIGILVLAGVLFSSTTITTITTTVTSNPIYALLALAGIAYLFYSNRAYRLMEQEEQKNISLNKEKAVGKLFLLLLIVGVGVTGLWTWLKGIGPTEIDNSINLAREALTGTMSDGVTQVATNENITRGVLALGIAIVLLAIMSIFSKGAHSLLRLLGLLLALGILGYSFTQFAPTQTAHIKNWAVKTWELAQETGTTPRSARIQQSSAGANTPAASGSVPLTEEAVVKFSRFNWNIAYPYNLVSDGKIGVQLFTTYDFPIIPEEYTVRPNAEWLERNFRSGLPNGIKFTECIVTRRMLGNPNLPDIYLFMLSRDFIRTYMEAGPRFGYVPFEVFHTSAGGPKLSDCKDAR